MPAISTIEVTLLPDGRMDARNAALYLGLEKKTLAQWRSSGKGPRFIKRGRIWYFKVDLDTWLEHGDPVSQAGVRPGRNARHVPSPFLLTLR